MLNIYWKSSHGNVTLTESSFVTEDEFEKYIKSNQDILGGDIYLIHRQIRTGNKQGIPDMIGVDKDGRVCIVELKNNEASEDILPQVLGYALWAETNPDSIKAIWLESKQRPQDIEINWDNLDIRIILIAPSFKSMVRKMAVKIGYPVNLFQIRRFSHEQNEFLLVDKLEDEILPPVGPTRVKIEWDWAYYESEHGKDATDQFQKMVLALDNWCKLQGWSLPYNINKYYTGFKYGSKVIFNVAWGGTYTWKIRMKLPESAANGFKSEHWEFQNYDSAFHESSFRPINPTVQNIEELEGLLRKVYELVSGVNQ